VSSVCFQLGAREHYAVPRMLDSLGRLEALVTDAWAPPGSAWRRLPGRLGQRLAERFHEGLSGARVEAFTGGLLAFEAVQRVLPPRSYWHGCMRRNAWFENRAVQTAGSRGLFKNRPTVLAYSYAALGILTAAKAEGCRTVLMQIDPAIVEERIVRRECARWEKTTGQKAPWTPPPTAYWRRWLEETRIADVIVVNSEWSREALEKVKVPEEKIRVVPLAYEPPQEALEHQRVYPERFTLDRPLRILFLGSLILRKGIARLFDAIRLLHDAPVVFRFVGAEEVSLPEDLRRSAKVEWLGPVSRGEVHLHYKWADAFAFPTLSDGFGLTQIEAAAWGLPLIVTGRCGEVVSDRREGLILSKPEGPALAGAIRQMVQKQVDLESMSAAARKRSKDFTMAQIAPKLLQSVVDREF
jgi:glycosyltransferase involved in cell wall biosynthesis